MLMVMPGITIASVTAPWSLPRACGKLGFGWLLGNLEGVAPQLDFTLRPPTPLTRQWRANLIDGVMASEAGFIRGSALPTFLGDARRNQGDRPIVRLLEQSHYD